MICTLLIFLCLLCLPSLYVSISACAQAAVSFSFGKPKAPFLRAKQAASYKYGNTTQNAQKLTIL